MFYLAVSFACCGYRTIFRYLQRNLEPFVYVYLRNFRMKPERKLFIY